MTDKPWIVNGFSGRDKTKVEEGQWGLKPGQSTLLTVTAGEDMVRQ